MKCGSWRTRPRRPSATPIMVGVALGLFLGGDAHPQEVGRIAGRILTTIPQGEREPVAGVTVRVAELGLATLSDDEGRFGLDAVAPGLRELHTELMGCVLEVRTLEVLPGRTTEAELVVRQPAVMIPGLVVRGVSPRAPEADRAYSVGTVELDEDSGSRSIADIIRGAFPGVTVLSQSGLAGQEISIQLRGPTSITGRENPLVVVDGITTTGGVVDLNPSDVASVRVLKGAAAAAEYGARGAAGVIEIATRGVTPSPSETSGPIVVIDGRISGSGLAGVDTGDIVDTRLLTGAQAAVLLGPDVEDTGVLWITTGRSRPSATPEGPVVCAPEPN